MIFLSYARADEPAMRQLRADLEVARVPVWVDDEMRGGDRWWDTVLGRIRECDVFGFVLSEASAASKPCRAELAYARDLGLPVLPIQVDDVGSVRTLPLADLQIVDYRDRTVEHAMRLLTAVTDLRAARGPLPEPLPAAPSVPYAYLSRLAALLDAPSLTPDQQADLVHQIRAGLADEDEPDVVADLRGLLARLRRRGDLTVRNAADIEALVASTPAAGAGDAAGAAPGAPGGPGAPGVPGVPAAAALDPGASPAHRHPGWVAAGALAVLAGLLLLLPGLGLSFEYADSLADSISNVAAFVTVVALLLVATGVAVLAAGTGAGPGPGPRLVGWLCGLAATATWALVVCLAYAGQKGVAALGTGFVAIVLAGVLGTAGLAVAVVLARRQDGVRLRLTGLSRSAVLVAGLGVLGGAGLLAFGSARAADGAGADAAYLGGLVPLAWLAVLSVALPMLAVASRPPRLGQGLLAGWLVAAGVAAGCNLAWWTDVAAEWGVQPAGLGVFVASLAVTLLVLGWATHRHGADGWSVRDRPAPTAAAPGTPTASRSTTGTD